MARRLRRQFDLTLHPVHHRSGRSLQADAPRHVLSISRLPADIDHLAMYNVTLSDRNLLIADFRLNDERLQNDQ